MIMIKIIIIIEDFNWQTASIALQ